MTHSVSMFKQKLLSNSPASKRIGRLERAMELRDAGLKLVEARGHWAERRDYGKVLMASGGEFFVFHRTPFTRPRRPLKELELEYVAAVRAHLYDPSCGLSIWRKYEGELLNVEWEGDVVLNVKRSGSGLSVEWDVSREVAINGFRRGDWETAFIAAANQIADEGKDGGAH